MYIKKWTYLGIDKTGHVTDIAVTTLPSTCYPPPLILSNKFFIINNDTDIIIRDGVRLDTKGKKIDTRETIFVKLELSKFQRNFIGPFQKFIMY